jgi:phenylalanyl-tRNA synthetase alpha chain
MKTYVHPLTDITNAAVEYFSAHGFSVASGPELEMPEFNFDKLNVPKDHPSRDVQDTFYTTDGRVPRTHTSPVQVRYMMERQPPLRAIVPGKVYRNEATDMTHEAEFYQLEGIVVDTDVHLGHMISVLEGFFKHLFAAHVEVRMRPSFFPFVEPGVEIDLRLTGDNVPERMKNRWIEIMGAGMIHPHVLNASGIDARRYKGFAFGAGLERLAMFKYAIDDVRHFSSGDARVTSQFFV